MSNDSNSRSAAAPAGVRIVPARWPHDRAALHGVREAVFVREQGVPLALEHDAGDAQARHFLALDAAGTAVGTVRLLADGHLGRLAVVREWRGRGVGRALLDAAMGAAAAAGMREVVLHAQVQAQGFYAAAGFAPHGPEFLEAGIRHVRMVRMLA